MKKLLFSFSLLVIVASCSQQKFAFRKTIPVLPSTSEIVKNETPTTNHIQLKNYPLDKLKLDTTLAKIDLNQRETELASTEKTSPITTTPEWKETKEKSEIAVSPNKPKQSQKTHANGNGFAIAGFILSILGLFVFGVIFGILGIVFSAIGLKSDRKGLAIAGIVIGIIATLIGIALIAVAIALS